MPHRIVPTSLKYIIEPDDVALNVCVRVLYAVAHSSLGRKINHYIEFPCCKERVDKRLIYNIAFYKVIAGRRLLTNPFYLSKAVVFERWIVVIVEVVETSDINSCAIKALLKKSLDKVCAYEASTACNEDVHWKRRYEVRYIKK